MVRIPFGTGHSGPAKEKCIKRFAEWWTAQEMRRIMSELDPGIETVLDNTIGATDMAGFMYDMVGPRFMRDVGGDREKRDAFLREILEAAIKKKHIRKSDIIGMGGDRRIQTISGVVERAGAETYRRMAHELDLPPSVAVREHSKSPPVTEVVEPHTPLNPLYDYQYSTGMVVRSMLEGRGAPKRKLIAVPTGSGKTRMMVQTLIEWLNDGKPSKDMQQNNSKFILWVAQSWELCEQALSTFRSVFESVGRRGTTLRLHRFWGNGSSLPAMDMEDMLDERSVIVANIQSLHKLLPEQPELLERLGRLTSCIIIDEAHHSVAPSYTDVLRTMGFNWNNRKTEISEWGIVLIGLTATPFRGTGDNEETRVLARRYGGVHYPTIPYMEEGANYKPHALIDCQTSALVGEDVHILGERSYDRDGFIPDTAYFWSIRHLGAGRSDDEQGWTSREGWTSHGSKNVTFRFPRPGMYEVALKVVDNEGDPGESTERIIIKESEDDDSDPERQKMLYGKLIKRKILCDVYHHVLDAVGTVRLTARDQKHLETFGEFQSQTLKDVGVDQKRNMIILDEIVRLRENGRKKILFFGCSVEHSRRIALYLKMRGVKTHYVDSKTGPDSRADSIERFRNGDLEVLCNFGVLTTGFDAPNVDCVFVGRPVKSTLLYTQMIGRGMRGTKSGGTADVVVVDINDNFQLQDDSAVELGWKIFEPYWKRYVDTADAPTSDPSKTPRQDGMWYGDAADALHESG